MNSILIVKLIWEFVYLKLCKSGVTFCQKRSHTEMNIQRCTCVHTPVQEFTYIQVKSLKSGALLIDFSWYCQDWVRWMHIVLSPRGVSRTTKNKQDLKRAHKQTNKMTPYTASQDNNGEMDSPCWASRKTNSFMALKYAEILQIGAENAHRYKWNSSLQITIQNMYI